MHIDDASYFLCYFICAKITIRGGGGGDVEAISTCPPFILIGSTWHLERKGLRGMRQENAYNRYF